MPHRNRYRTRRVRHMNHNDSHTMFPIVPIETIKTALKQHQSAPADERAGCRGCGACACKREVVEAAA